MKVTFPMLALMAFFSYSARSQQINNVRAVQQDNNIIITYDLEGPSGQVFEVNLYGSHNNYANPVRQVSGDVGANIRPGNNRRIVWNAKSEMGAFEGDLDFEVRAESVASPLSLTSPSGGKTFKAGNSLDIGWSGGSAGEQITIELLRSGSVDKQIGKTKNSGSYSWAIPSDIAKSEYYKVRVSGNSGAVESGAFTLKQKGSKTPLYIGAGALVAGGAAILLLSGGGDSGLPDPPEPPTN